MDGVTAELSTLATNCAPATPCIKLLAVYDAYERVQGAAGLVCCWRHYEFKSSNIGSCVPDFKASILPWLIIWHNRTTVWLAWAKGLRGVADWT